MYNDRTPAQLSTCFQEEFTLKRSYYGSIACCDFANAYSRLSSDVGRPCVYYTFCYEETALVHRVLSWLLWGNNEGGAYTCAFLPAQGKRWHLEYWRGHIWHFQRDSWTVKKYRNLQLSRANLTGEYGICDFPIRVTFQAQALPSPWPPDFKRHFFFKNLALFSKVRIPPPSFYDQGFTLLSFLILKCRHFSRKGSVDTAVRQYPPCLGLLQIVPVTKFKNK